MKLDPFHSGVLDRAVHERLVADIDRYARDARIQPRWIYTSLLETCGKQELAWVKRFRFHVGENKAGLCYVGPDMEPDITTRMAAIAGALTRNFIYGCVMTLNELIEAANEGDTPTMSCLLVPNFFVGDAADQPAWRLGVLYDALLRRQIDGKQTVLHVSSLAQLGKNYGVAVRRHIEQHYELLITTD